MLNFELTFGKTVQMGSFKIILISLEASYLANES